MAHLPFVDEALSAKPLTPPTCGLHLQKAKLGRYVVGLSCVGYDGPPKNGGGHGPERTRRIPKRHSHDPFRTAPWPQGSPVWATGAFSRGKGEAASGGPGRAGAVSARAGGQRGAAP